MPSFPPDSTDSPPPSLTPSPEGAFSPVEPARPAATPLAWRTNAWLFLATVASAFVTWIGVHGPPWGPTLVQAGQYTAALMAILLAHEFGHYIEARLHRV